MRFSIIIPVFNAERYLHECLDSIVNQNFDNYELICVNDGSTDMSPVILKDYSEKYSWVRVISQVNKGMSAARNLGIREAKGEYILFVDSDDMLAPDALSIINSSIINEDLLCFNASVLKMPSGLVEQDKGFNATYSSGWDYYNQNALVTRKIHFVAVWQRAYKREFLIENQLQFDESLKRAEDDLFTTLLCYYAHHIKIISDSLYLYRLHQNNISLSQDKQRLFDSIYVYNTLIKFFKDKEINKTVINRILASGVIGCFSKSTHEKYHVTDAEVKEKINIKTAKSICISYRHKWLWFLISINPQLFRTWQRLMGLIH